MFTMVGAPGHEQWLLVAVYAKAWSTALVAAMSMLLLLPSLLLHSFPLRAKPWLYMNSAQHEPPSLATALMPHAPHPSMVWGTQL